MSSKADPQSRDIRIDHYDLEGARTWMSGICGPHRLETATPERIRFHHSGNVFKSMATEIPELGGLSLGKIGEAGLPLLPSSEVIPLLHREADRKTRGIIVG